MRFSFFPPFSNLPLPKLPLPRNPLSKLPLPRSPLPTLPFESFLLGEHGPDAFSMFLGDDVNSLTPGTPVFCRLAGVAEHTGIAVGKEIIHLDGSGEIVKTSPREFIARLDGYNPAVNVYYAALAANKPLGSKKVADRARRMVGKFVDYDLLRRNCHGFVLGCISGNFEQSFILKITQVEAQISQFYLQNDWTWRSWDGWR